MYHKSNLGNCGLLADLLAFGIDGHSDTCVSVASAWPTNLTFLEVTRVRRGKAATIKFQQKNFKFAVAVKAQHGAEGLQPLFIPLAWDTFGLTDAKPDSWLFRQLKLAPGIDVGCCGRSFGPSGRYLAKFWNALQGVFAGLTSISLSSLIPQYDAKLFSHNARTLVFYTLPIVSTSPCFSTQAPQSGIG